MPYLDHQQPLHQFHPIDRWRVRQLHIQIRRRCGTDLRDAVPHRLRRRAGWVCVYRRIPSGRCALHHGALVVRTRPAALKNAAKHGWLKRLSAFGSNRSRVECPKSGREADIGSASPSAWAACREHPITGCNFLLIGCRYVQLTQIDGFEPCPKDRVYRRSDGLPHDYGRRSKA